MKLEILSNSIPASDKEESENQDCYIMIHEGDSITITIADGVSASFDAKNFAYKLAEIVSKQKSNVSIFKETFNEFKDRYINDWNKRKKGILSRNNGNWKIAHKINGPSAATVASITIRKTGNGYEYSLMGSGDSFIFIFDNNRNLINSFPYKSYGEIPNIPNAIRTDDTIETIKEKINIEESNFRGGYIILATDALSKLILKYRNKNIISYLLRISESDSVFREGISLLRKKHRVLDDDDTTLIICKLK